MLSFQTTVQVYATNKSEETIIPTNIWHLAKNVNVHFGQPRRCFTVRQLIIFN